ncbi:MAG: ion channel, partial [Pseudomonadota bacterium]|nr:ion channel [Pseudomonadota bacterium]
MTQDEPETVAAAYPRMGSGTLTYLGLSRDAWRDAYHVLLTMPLIPFLAVMAAGFLGINALFACLYLLDPGGVSGARPENFQDAFFFSVQTLGTLGYGVMAPRSLFSNLVVTFESFVGLFNLAIAAGLMFARISRPTARIMFSDRAVVTSWDGAPTLMFRAANRRRNLVVEAEVTVTLLHDVKTAEGTLLRRFDELSVLRSRSPLFFMTWQVMHRIDEAS